MFYLLFEERNRLNVLIIFSRNKTDLLILPCLVISGEAGVLTVFVQKISELYEKIHAQI
jgi:hypothetical protein